MAATSTIHTYLEYKTSDQGATWTKVADIKSYPDLSSPPERIDVTTLSNEQRQYVPGVRDLPDYDFPANYDKTQYAAIVALADTELSLRIKFGETGEYGTFSFTGKIDATISGGDVNAAREMTVNVYPSSEIEMDT